MCNTFISLLLEGDKEETSDMLRSILAQFEYHYQICLWDSKGVPFRTYLYVPETHPITGREFHEREDFAHLLKVNDNYLYFLIYRISWVSMELIMC